MEARRSARITASHGQRVTLTRGIYSGARASLMTQHRKELVMQPPFLDRLGVQLEVARGFDTDTLGTFTRDVARLGSQIDAARKKAEKGMDLLGTPYGVASEGSFGPSPYGMFPWDFEIVVFLDRLRGIEIVGRAQGPAHHVHEYVGSRDQLEEFARKAGFPEHGLTLRPNDERDSALKKGIADWDSLYADFDEALAVSRTKTVFAETDFRAHMNPTRMKLIFAATADLIARIESACPHCETPGFWLVERIGGLPCDDCLSPTNEVRAERWACVTGDYEETRDVGANRRASPARCSLCNP